MSAIDSMESGMREINEIDISQILNNLIDSTKDIELKTEILKPKQLASLKLLSDFIFSFDLEHSSKLIDDFLDIYFKYMVSYNRQSRQEIIRAISYQMEIKTKSLADKLTKQIQ